MSITLEMDENSNTCEEIDDQILSVENELKDKDFQRVICYLFSFKN